VCAQCAHARAIHGPWDRTVDEMSESTDAEPKRPQFRGCAFCYAGEWVYYGAKRAVRRVGDSG